MKGRVLRALSVPAAGMAIAVALVTGGPSVIGQSGLTDPIVFVSRAIPRRGHIADAAGVTGSLPGVGSISRFVVASPGRLVIREPNGSLRVLVDGGAPTTQSLHLVDVHAPEVSYDGRRIVFAGLPNGTYSAADRNVGAHPGAWRIYTINVDGTGLRQVTFTPPPLDLSQFDFESDFNLADDIDPNWLPDGRIVFSSTRWPAVAQYRDPRTTNLYVVNADGSHLHRITAERNGADRPLVDPQTGKIVYSRWWRNGHPASDNMTTLTDPVYGGYLLHLGLATDDSNRYTAAQRASLGPAYDKVSRNLWISAAVNPDGTEATLWNGGDDSDALMNTLYGGSFDEAGHLYSSLFPLENFAEVAGFGGVRYHRRGVTGRNRPPGHVLGVTDFLPSLPLVFPALERIYQSEYVAEPEVVPGTNLLVVSIAPDYRQDYGLYLLTRDGRSRQLLFDNPGTTELRARLVRARALPPVLPDQPTLMTETASLLPPRAEGPYDIDGTFTFDALNVYFNAPVDTNIVSAPPIGSAGSIRFYADFIKDSPTTNSRYNWPSLLRELAVAPDGSVREPNAPANIPLFEQLRTPQAAGYRVPVTNPPNTADFKSGAAHVAGMNFGRPGTTARCVGCHMGHTLIQVPATAEAARWTNLSPGATPTASSGTSVARLIDRRARTEAAFEHWRSQTATGQWVQLTFPVAVTVRTVRLYGASAVSTIGNAMVQLYADPAATIGVAQAASGAVADGGTDVAFADVPARAVRVAFSQVSGTQASLAEIEVIAAGRSESGQCSVPGAPTRLTATGSGLVASFNWVAPVSGGSLTDYLLEIGSTPGASNLGTQAVSGSTTSFTSSGSAGTYYVRVRARNACGSAVSNEVMVTLTTSCVAPGLPGRPVAVVQGSTVGVTWAPAAGATAHVFEAGSIPGQANLMNGVVNGLALTAQAPPGVYFVRTRGQNACGTGPASPETMIAVGCTPPGPLSPLRYTVNGRQVTLAWNASAGAADYVLEAGTSSGASNVLTMSTASTSLSGTAPPNTYYVRVRPRNACGSGAYSNEVSFTVN